jgi:hypothetical protein
MKIHRSPYVLAALAMLGAATQAPAQRVDPLKLIDFHVNAERQNSSFGGTEREGGRFTLTFHDTGQSYAISMVQRDENRFAVSVLQRRVTGNDTTFAPMEMVIATLGRPTPLRTLPYVTVVIDGTRRADAPVSALPSVQPVLASYGRTVTSYFGTCCVTCGVVTACGCAVKHDCGSCCSDGCCPKQLPEVMLPGTQNTQPLSRLGQRPCRPVPDAERVYPQLRPASGTMAIRS